jgi:cytochrome b
MNTVKVWDIFVRIFHWTLVGTMISLYWSGETYKNLHSYLGYWVICLVLLRIIWGFIGTKHALFYDFLYRPSIIYDYLRSLIKGNPKHYMGHNPAGGLMIIVMLFTLLVTAFTGLKTLGSDGQGPLANTDSSIFRLAYADDDEHDDDEPKYRDGHHQKKQKNEFWEDIHESMTNFMIFLVIAHIGGVIVASWIHKENLLIGMITGIKKKE